MLLKSNISCYLKATYHPMIIRSFCHSCALAIHSYSSFSLIQVFFRKNMFLLTGNGLIEQLDFDRDMFSQFLSTRSWAVLRLPAGEGADAGMCSWIEKTKNCGREFTNTYLDRPFSHMCTRIEKTLLPAGEGAEEGMGSWRRYGFVRSEEHTSELQSR